MGQSAVPLLWVSRPVQSGVWQVLEGVCSSARSPPQGFAQCSEQRESRLLWEFHNLFSCLDQTRDLDFSSSRCKTQIQLKRPDVPLALLELEAIQVFKQRHTVDSPCLSVPLSYVWNYQPLAQIMQPLQPAMYVPGFFIPKSQQDAECQA